MASETLDCDICLAAVARDQRFCRSCIEVMPRCSGCHEPLPSWELTDGQCKACRRYDQEGDAA